MSIIEKPKRPPPSPNPDDDDQRHLRELGDQIKSLMDAHDVGGVVLLDSRKSSSWTIVLPKWSGLQPDPATGHMRLRINSKTPEAREIGDATLGMIASTRDMARDVAQVFGELFKQAKDALAAQGVVVDHKLYGGKGGVGPAGNLPE